MNVIMALVAADESVVNSTARTIAAIVSTLFIGGSSGWYCVRLIRRIQNDYISTGSKRNEELEAKLQKVEEHEEALENRVRHCEFICLAAKLDRMELIHILESHDIPIPAAIRERMNQDASATPTS